MNILLLLFLEFFKIGLFSVGGGLSTLPFLYELCNKYDWFDTQMLTTMVAISESTPGPIGVNMATYAGYHTAGILGGLIATLGLITPSIIVITIIAHFLTKFKNNPYVESVFRTIRPIATGLIFTATYQLFKVILLNPQAYQSTKQWIDLFQLKEIILFAVILTLIFRYKKSPVIYFIGAALVGIFLF